MLDTSCDVVVLVLALLRQDMSDVIDFLQVLKILIESIVTRCGDLRFETPGRGGLVENEVTLETRCLHWSHGSCVWRRCRDGLQCRLLLGCQKFAIFDPLVRGSQRTERRVELLAAVDRFREIARILGLDVGFRRAWLESGRWGREDTLRRLWRHREV